MPRFKLRRLKMLLSRKSSCRLKLKRRRYSWNLWTGVLWDEEKARKHGQVGRGKREGGREAASFTTLPWSLRKQLTFSDPTTGFLLKWRLRIECRNFILMTSHYPDQGTASDWSCRLWNLLQPIRSTTQIWVVTVISMDILHSFLRR